MIGHMKKCAEADQDDHGNRDGNPDSDGFQNAEAAQKDPEIEHGEHECQERLVHHIGLCDAVSDQYGSESKDKEVQEHLDADNRRSTELVLEGGGVEHAHLQESGGCVEDVGHGSTDWDFFMRIKEKWGRTVKRQLHNLLRTQLVIYLMIQNV